MNAVAKFTACLGTCPLVAILRGVRPNEIDGLAAALVGAGFRIIEVRLNSPDPLRSIERIAKRFGQDVLIGAGTVLDTGSVRDVANAGGEIIVSPATDADVIRSAGGWSSMEPWLAAGADGFGLGSALYVAGRSATDVAARARTFVDALARQQAGTRP